MSARAFVIGLVCACGGVGSNPGDGAGVDASIDSAPGSCGAAGNGVVNGTVGGASVTPVMRAFQVTFPGEGVAIVIDETGGTCGTPSTSGEQLVLAFCDAPSARAYTVVGEQQFACPGADAGALIEQDGGSDFGEATGGSITIDSATPTCVSGTFAIDMRAASGSGANEPISGSFNAVVCP